MNKYYSLLILLGVLLSASCNSDLYQSYYKGDGTSLYHIHKLKFKNNEGEKMWADFSFLDQVDNKQNNARCYYTFYLANPVKVKETYIKFDNEKVQLDSLEKLYIKKDKNKYEIRFSGLVNVEELEKSFLSNGFEVIINNSLYYSPTASSLKKIASLRNSLWKIYQVSE